VNHRRPEYDSKAFHDMWHSRTPLREIAEALGVSITAVWIAARNRGFQTRSEILAELS